jgi:hypothetical protein
MMARNDDWAEQRRQQQDRDAIEYRRAGAWLDVVEPLLHRLSVLVMAFAVFVAGLVAPGYRLHIWLGGAAVLAIGWLALDKWRWHLRRRRHDLYETLGYWR